MPEFAERLRRLPPYLFAEIDRKKREVRARGVDVIDLGIGDPDLPTPPHIIQALQKAAEDPANHRYPSYEGLLAYRQAVADWYAKRFNVRLDPDQEVLTLIGSKEGTAHMPLAFVNPGDVVLVPDPGYPVYAAGTWFAGGEVHFMPLRRENGFLPDLGAIPREAARRAKLMYLNYPNNPTAAVATRDFFTQVVAFARRHGILVCHDLMYSELKFDGFEPPSLLEVDGAREVGVEFHSLSKTYSMTGWRLGFCVGNRQAVAGLGAVKTNVDSGVFQAVQHAGVAALTGPQDLAEQYRRTYQERRDIVVRGLRALGWQVDVPKGTFFVWAPVPGGLDSRAFATRLLEEAGVVVTPGVGFGPSGEGFYRIALTVDQARIAEAMERLKRLRG
ncbi:MAG: LL-diaminopimelate aminotransferase [Candidatus Rokubacteria bacterium]|nr:LL-diaminopimelate aminotransferase [Candidatus Rokubacteria bacterium]MBI2555596.1 LL-diaminopimelate aminotransferase [Candidatus Rokubacteria bacterium]